MVGEVKVVKVQVERLIKIFGGTQKNTSKLGAKT